MPVVDIDAKLLRITMLEQRSKRNQAVDIHHYAYESHNVALCMLYSITKLGKHTYCCLAGMEFKQEG